MDSRKPADIRALAGVRAVPPVLIVLFHFSEGHHYSGVRWLDLIAARGYLWVEFFFALSGFILIHVYGARAASLFTARGYGDFLKARLIRLYPLHLFMLLFMVALVIALRSFAHMGGYVSIFDLPWHQNIQLRGFVASLFLVHAWNTLDSLTWNGVSWFVSVEFALCLLFPLFARLADGALWRGAVLIAAGLAGLVLLIAQSRHGLDITFHNGVLRGLCDFSIGAGMAVLYRHLKPRDRLADGAHTLIQLAVIAWLLAAFTQTGWAHARGDIWSVLPMLALILALSFDRGLVARALKTRLPQTLGAWSYAIYMGQTAWLLGIRVLEMRLYPPGDTRVLGMAFSTLIWGLEPVLLVLVCILWGGMLAVCIEHPASARLKRLLTRAAR